MKDYENKVPLYFQLVRTLKRQIEEEMQPNDKIPSEKEICDMYSVSRTTVRLAMAELEKEGCIYRLQGKGSFVSSVKKTSPNSLMEVDERNFLNKVYCNSYDSKFIAFGITSVFPNNIKTSINEMKNIFAQFLISIKEKKSLLLDYYFYNIKFNTLNQSDLEKKTIDEILNEMNITIKMVEESYTVEPASQELSNKLNVNINTPLLCIEKSYFDNNNEIIITCVKHIVTERYQYKNFIEN